MRLDLWKKLDLLGRTLVLCAVAFQLLALGSFQSLRQRGDILHIMENQYFTGLMIREIANGGPSVNAYNRVEENLGKLKLFSEWEKNPWNRLISTSNLIFVFLLTVGGLISLVARYLEIKDK